ncbi:TrmH family RNA methyltransferase [Haloflavibacter putidus]|uniref:tRNA (guanosine(18)-2'-O)-methyltransferase n=1 Tax=Haloflavibacter putidus TaxID=2576776 RepID=A0A507ZS63_9FLAO|nr:RNA methyltransferase [Haloflavibacter putidus]TQD39114.1 RNA methyltransferase [Haloflavibacter putidus]
MTDLNLLTHLETFLTENRKQRFQEVLVNRTNHFTVATEDVYQLHNTSAVIRSCDVFGIQNIHIIEERNRKRIDREIAMGAQKWVNVNRYNHVNESIENLRTKGYQIIATTPHNNACMLNDFDISKPAALFFGTEKEGLSQEVLENADGFLKIPMVGFTESLNISVSAAIILQALTHKLKQSNIAWQLSKKDELATRYFWAKNSIQSSEKIIKRFKEKVD